MWLLDRELEAPVFRLHPAGPAMAVAASYGCGCKS